MNEQIRELAEQAMAHASYYVWFSEKQVFAEKFAELIILECAAIISGAVALREPASTYVSKILELNNER